MMGPPLWQQDRGDTTVLTQKMIMNEWDHVRFQVKKGLEMLGHDISIVGYGYKENIALGKRKLGNRKN